MSISSSMIDANLESAAKSTGDFIGSTPVTDKSDETEFRDSESVHSGYLKFLTALADNRLESIDCSPKSQSMKLNEQSDALEKYESHSELSEMSSDHSTDSGESDTDTFYLYGSPDTSDGDFTFQVDSDEDDYIFYRREKAKLRAEARKVSHGTKSKEEEKKTEEKLITNK